MSAFSLYLRPDLLTRLRNQATITGKSIAALVSAAIDKAYPAVEMSYIVGRDRQAWTTPLNHSAAVLARSAAIQAHPGLVLYQLPAGIAIVPGDTLPESAVECSNV